jgi:polysaccharide export outer membrane protein
MRTFASAILGVSLLAAPAVFAAQTSPPNKPTAQKPPAQAAPAQKPPAATAQTPPAQPAPASPAAAKPPATPPATGPSVTPPADYIIGPDDVLGVLFWREKDLSVEQVTVRPDGMITLPLVNDLKAAGLTPEQLREAVMKAANRFVEDPNATIVVRQINSRRFYVTGQVGKPGTYPLLAQTTILQAIALAGGLAEYAKGNDIVLMRTEGGKTKTFPFRYKDVIKGKKLEQNIELRPGDTLVVP